MCKGPAAVENLMYCTSSSVWLEMKFKMGEKEEMGLEGWKGT